MRRGRQVRIADAEANNIDPASGNFAFFLVYFSKKVGWKFFQTRSFSDGNRHRFLRQVAILAIFSFFDNPLRPPGTTLSVTLVEPKLVRLFRQSHGRWLTKRWPPGRAH